MHPFGENSISNLEINKRLKNVKNFNGCYAKDELPETLKKGWYIVNLEDHNQPGSHWVVFYFDNLNIWYCDSFGVSAPNSVLDKCIGNLYYNNLQIQDLSSSSCGYFCMLLVKMNNFEKYLKQFSKNTFVNEYILKNLCDLYGI